MKRARSGFTLLELLIAMGIIAFLASAVLVVYGRAGESARTAATKTLIKQLDSALQDRLEAFRGQSVRNASRQLRQDVLNSITNPVLLAQLTAYGPEVWDSLYWQLHYRGSFPQRQSDLYGFSNDDDNGAGTGLSRDASLYRTLVARYGLTAAQSATNPELLFYFLTEGETFGGPPLDIDRLHPNAVADADGDGMREFSDGWGNPIWFYSRPTGLLRPSGNPSGMTSISVSDYQQARALIHSLQDIGNAALPATDYDHSLNIDPLDSIGEIQSHFSAITTTFEDNYQAYNTYWTPLLVSSGSDGSLGIDPPTSAGLPGMCVVSSADAVYDNLTNQQRGGF